MFRFWLEFSFLHTVVLLFYGDDVGVEEEDKDKTTADLASMETEELFVLGLTPVKRLLMYGQPGCGKTALAKEISRALKALDTNTCGGRFGF